MIARFAQLKLIFLQSLMLFPSLGTSAETIRVGYFDYPPIVTKTQNEPVGFLIDYTQMIFKDAGLLAQWQEVPVARGLLDLQQGQLDVLLMLLKSPEREKIVKYSETGLFEARPAICGKEGRIKPWARSKLRLAHSLASLLPHSIRQHQLIPVTPNNVTERMLSMLEKDRIDAFFYVNPEVLGHYTERMPKDLRIQCYVLRDSAMPVYMVYAKGISSRLESLLNKGLAWHDSRNNFEFYLQSKLSELESSKLTITNSESKAFELGPRRFD